MTLKAVIAFEDGSLFRGKAFGAKKTVVGEAVFNTSMTGYQEVLTDPSYFGQVVTMTAPQIGNYGISSEDQESQGPQINGFVVHELSPITSNWRSQQSLDSYLADHGIPAISGVDTRAIAKKLRTVGAMRCCLSTEGLSDEDALDQARSWPGLIGVDYVREVSCELPYRWEAGAKENVPFSVVGTELAQKFPKDKRYHIVAYDFGAKRNIFRKLSWHGFDVQVVPANTPASYVDEQNPDGIFLSNGPGDPGAVSYAHATVAKLMERYPVFGICLGHQMIAHALGASTFKLKFGHRGANHPVKNCETGRVSITSQNHGFATEQKDLENRGAIVTELNLNDGTVEGLRHRELPVFSVQYHPEASPGPHDSDELFEDFYNLVAQHSE